MSAKIDEYRMNPAEDEIKFGDELADGMWVLPGSTLIRTSHTSSEEDRIRDQRFRQVTRLRRQGGLIVFVGVWVDGYQVHTYSAEGWAWIVKKVAPGQGGETP